MGFQQKLGLLQKDQSAHLETEVFRKTSLLLREGSTKTKSGGSLNKQPPSCRKKHIFEFCLPKIKLITFSNTLD